MALHALGHFVKTAFSMPLGLSVVFAGHSNAAACLHRYPGFFTGGGYPHHCPALGDDSVPDIGSRPIAEIRPEERTTPAGRFIAERGRNTGGEDIVWVDYDAAVSMHRVRTTNAKERRLERLASPSPDDNRISYGCINIPVAFFDAIVAPTFAAHRAIVYVLPEVKSMQQVFSFHALLKRN